MHPNGQLPAYEWNFGDVNPPVHALAALRVFQIDGSRDRRVAASGSSTSCCSASPGGPTPRTRRATTSSAAASSAWTTSARSTAPRPCPTGYVLEQADGTGWMALLLPEHARDRARAGRPRPGLRGRRDQVLRALHADRRRRSTTRGLWDEADGFYYDQIRRASDGARWPVRARSMTGLIPLCAVAVGDPAVIGRLPRVPGPGARLPARAGPSTGRRRSGPRERRAADAGGARRARPPAAPAGAARRRGRVPLPARRARALGRLPRAPVRDLGGRPRDLERRLRAGRVDDGALRRQLQLARPGLVPGQLPRDRGARCATTSTWATTHRSSIPRGSGQQRTLRRGEPRPVRAPGRDLPARRARAGARCSATSSASRRDPAWRDSLLFHEYFHGDNGSGLGASHQTGWTGLVADLIVRLGRVRAAAP